MVVLGLDYEFSALVRLDGWVSVGARAIRKNQANRSLTVAAGVKQHVANGQCQASLSGVFVALGCIGRYLCSKK